MHGEQAAIVLGGALGVELGRAQVDEVPSAQGGADQGVRLGRRATP